jgi:hypothetical protein
LNEAGWRAVTVGSVVLAMGLAGVLLAQDGLFSGDPGLPEHPDGLTTLALVLAILAFLVQIFVFVFQTNASAASLQRSEELNTDTQALLSRIQANSNATQRVLFSQFDRLLDYVVDPRSKGPERSPGPPIGEVLAGERAEPDDLDQGPATVADVQRIVSEFQRPADRPSFAVPSDQGPSDEDLRIVDYLQSWPSQPQAEAAVAELASLSPISLAVLTRMGMTEIVQRLEGERVGLWKGRNAPEGVREMTMMGLLREDDDWMTLTDHGRELLRVLPIGKPNDDRPSWYDEVLGPLTTAS